MRIIAGRFKGHRLVAFKANHIRPTTDRVKETIFNKIQSHIPGAKVLDLFSGTGSLGLEALSRGAESVQFVDSHAKSIHILNQNVDKLDVRGSVSISKVDVLRFLKQAEDSFDLIFIDPPFTKKMGEEVMQTLAQSKVFHAQSLILIESTKHENMQDHYLELERIDVKSFGDKDLSVFSQVEGK